MHTLLYIYSHFNSPNILISLLITLLVLVLLYYILALFLPENILRIVMAIVAIILVLDLFVGCADVKGVDATVNTGHGAITFHNDGKTMADTTQKFDQQGNPNFGPKRN